MSLIGFVGEKRTVNKKLMLYAADHSPALIIDCANAADPHALYPEVTLEQMSRLFVIELELLYKFRDVLLRVPRLIEQLNTKLIIVTTSDHLFNYQDEVENKNVIEHSWQLMKGIGKRNTVLVALVYDSVYLEYAKKYCDRLKYGTYRNKPTYND